MNTGKLTLAIIKDRCAEEGECWIWKNALGQTGYPIIRARPHPCMLVRRVVAVLSGRAPAPRQPVVTTCGDKLCCNPEHIRLSNYKTIGRAAAKRGSFSGLERRIKVAAGRRKSKNIKLSIEIAREIRLSPDTGPVLAKRYTVDTSLINAIRRGDIWVDRSNPFAGLGARA